MLYGDQWTCDFCGYENLFLRKHCRNCKKQKPENIKYHSYKQGIMDKQSQRFQEVETPEIHCYEGELINPPKPAGCYIIGSGINTVSFSISKKPLLIHRFFCKLFLGWKWQDNAVDKHLQTRQLNDLERKSKYESSSVR